MGGTLLRRRGLRRHPSGLSGRERSRPAGFRPADHVARLRAAASEGGDGAGALTLDDQISDAWRALGECETAQCPLCGGEMGRSSGRVVSRSDAEEEEPCGECVDCGTRLS
jgi:hypothetical protein